MNKSTVICKCVVRRAVMYLVLVMSSSVILGDSSGTMDLGNADAVIISEETTYEISDDGKAKYKVRTKTEVFREDGNRYAYIVLDESRFSKIKKFKGTLYGADGNKIRSLDKGDGFKMCGFSGFALYADNCQLLFDLSSADYPYTVEYEYEIEMKSLFFWPDWQPQKNIPVEYSRYTLIIPKDFKYAAKVSGNLPEPAKTEDGDEYNIVYEMRDVTPVEKEAYVYDPGNVFQHVKFSAHTYTLGNYEFTGGSWDGFGRDCFQMMKDCFLLNDRQKTKMAEISAQTSSILETCNRLHESITENTRYVAIEIGIGGWQPTPSNETFERGYGDCKDLATMYASMLREADIETRLALIMTKQVELTDPAFPSMRFNHVIFFAVIDNDTMWADPTCSFCDMGDLPWYDEDIYVLTLDSTGGTLVKTKKSSAMDNVCIRKAHVSLNGSRAVNIEYDFSGRGNTGHMLQSYVHYTEHDKKAFFLQESDFCVDKKARLGDIAINKGKSASVQARGAIRNAVQSVKQKKYVTLDYFEPLRECERTKLEDRQFPLNLEYPIAYLDSICIDIPDSWTIEALPDSVTYADAFGQLSVTYAQTDNQIIVAALRTCDRYFIPVDEFEEFSAYVRAIRDLYPSHFAFIAQ